MFYPDEFDEEEMVYGDEVEVISTKQKGKITSIWYDHNFEKKIKVGFGDVFDPNYREVECRPMDIRVVYSRYRSSRVFDSRFECPICGTPWHESVFNKNKWQDCLKCNKRKEDIV